MKNILVPVEDHRGIASVFQTAELAASMFSSRIEGVPLGPDFEALVAATSAIPISLNDDRLRRDLLLQLQALFDQFARRCSVDNQVTLVWNGEDLLTDIRLGSYGRVFDLIVVGRPSPDSRDARQATLESALFESGRPILVAPPEPPQSLGQAIAVAWNASTETARTVALAMPFLKRAKKAVVIAVEGAMVAGPSAESLLHSLERHGLRVDLDVVAEDGNAAGRTILARAAAWGADLLVKGGYTHSRLRQMIFGGATSQILAESQLPVFMAH